MLCWHGLLQYSMAGQLSISTLGLKGITSRKDNDFFDDIERRMK
jgi:hypothetical protein